MWHLANAEERAAEYPDTFRIPPAEKRRGLAVGDFAKLIFELKTPPEDGPSGERLWVQVRSLSEHGLYGGEVTSEAILPELPSTGTIVHFGAEHVADIEILARS